MKRYKLKLQMLSPIHIGTGYQIPPYEYKVVEDVFYRINVNAFLSSLTIAQKSEFYKRIDNTNPSYVRSFILENADVDKYCLYSCDAMDDIKDKYSEKINDPSNQLLVNEMPKRGNDYTPYIPGSSLKGAIRTAFVSCLADKKNIHFVRDDRSFEKDLLGYRDAKQDPFRCVKISDSVLKDRNVIFVSDATNFNPNKEGEKSMQMFSEQLYNLLDDEPDIYANGELAVDDKLCGASCEDRYHKRSKAVTLSIDICDIISSCKEFYLPKIEAEFNKFYKGGENENYVSPLLDVKFGENEFPLRIGHFSHCECVTVDGLRKPKTPTIKGKKMPFGTSRTASRGVPFGWIKATVTEK